MSPISRYNMESSKSHIWIAAVVLLAACGVCAGGRVRKPFMPTDSILDIINTEEVEKILEARKREQETGQPFIQRNDIGDGEDIAESTALSITDQEEARKALKSSKNALLITKRDYLKDDWCKAEPLVQKIREPGCVPVTILNKFCYGQCNSFYIPRGPRKRDNAFKSCSFCRPKKVTWVTVTLRCPGQDPPYRRRRVQKIKQCKCIAVDVN